MSHVKSTARHYPARGGEPDWVAIERACSGERVQLYSNELAIAIQRLIGLGMADTPIARRLGCSNMTVSRYRTSRPRLVRQQELHEAIAELISQGVRTKEIAQKLNCDRKTVYRHRIRIEQERDNEHGSDE